MIDVVGRRITRDQSRDTGMAMVLLSLILYLYFKREGFIVAALLLHLVNMTVPQAYRPVAVVWLGFSHLLGTTVSKIVLSVVFLLVVTPVAFARRLAGKDSLKLREFKASQDSAMLERNHEFTGRDIEKPY